MARTNRRSRQPRTLEHIVREVAGQSNKTQREFAHKLADGDCLERGFGCGAISCTSLERGVQCRMWFAPLCLRKRPPPMARNREKCRLPSDSRTR